MAPQTKRPAAKRQGRGKPAASGGSIYDKGFKAQSKKAHRAIQSVMHGPDPVSKTEESDTAAVMRDDALDFFSDLSSVPLRKIRPAENSSVTHAQGPVVNELQKHDVDGSNGAERIVAHASVSGKQLQDTTLWLDLGLCKPLIRAVGHVGFIAPTPVQVAAIPSAIKGRDICARAVTGSGKTGAFLLPTLHWLITHKPDTMRKNVRSVVLVPSRELGVQCHSMAVQLAQFASHITIELVIGGMSTQAQARQLHCGPDLVVATPGRLCDHLHNQVDFELDELEILVLDECDKMLTMTMTDQVEDIVDHCPDDFQTMLFSATMTKDVDEFATKHLHKPVNVDIGHVALAAQLRQEFVRVKPYAAPKQAREDGAVDQDFAQPQEGAGDLPVTAYAEEGNITKLKTQYLVALCTRTYTKNVIVFTKYRTSTHRLHILFNELGMPSIELHSDMTQEARMRALEQFINGERIFMFATDLAARGIDIKAVSAIINFDLPPTLTAYIHRVGRTARIGESGTAVSLVDEKRDSEIMRKILTLSKNTSTNQSSEVKRRVIPDDRLIAAAALVDEVFPKVRAALLDEELEEQIKEIESQIRQTDGAGGDALSKVLTTKPKHEWCMSKDEVKRRDKEARKQADKEAEIAVDEMKFQLRLLDEDNGDQLHKQKLKRRREREVKEREKQQEKEKRKKLRGEAPLQKGLLKKVKVAKIRKAKRMDKRAKRLAANDPKAAAKAKKARKTRETKSKKNHAKRHKSRGKKRNY